MPTIPPTTTPGPCSPRAPGETPHAQPPAPFQVDVLASPIGDLLLTGDGDRLTGVFLDVADRPAHPARPIGEELPPVSAVAQARQQLVEYFAGERTAFDVPLCPQGTAFQRAVWSALRAVPYGTTATYGEIARAIGRPAAARAVGAANRVNPIAVIVPCHRVIGAAGTLVGYAGGLHRKRWLLDHEVRHRRQDGSHSLAAR